LKRECRIRVHLFYTMVKALRFASPSENGLARLRSLEEGSSFAPIQVRMHTISNTEGLLYLFHIAQSSATRSHENPESGLGHVYISPSVFTQLAASSAHTSTSLIKDNSNQAIQNITRTPNPYFTSTNPINKNVCNDYRNPQTHRSPPHHNHPHALRQIRLRFRHNYHAILSLRPSGFQLRTLPLAPQRARL
jgi:hypothetical protein